jgi:transcriptional regulator with XRE-family HTH domain
MALTVDQVLELLREKQGELTQKDFAEKLGVSAAYLIDVYRGRRPPGPSILRFLKLEKRVTTVYWKTASGR